MGWFDSWSLFISVTLLDALQSWKSKCFLSLLPSPAAHPHAVHSRMWGSSPDCSTDGFPQQVIDKAWNKSPKSLNHQAPLWPCCPLSSKSLCMLSFSDRVSLLFSSGCPGTCYVDQAGPKGTVTHPPLPSKVHLCPPRCSLLYPTLKHSWQEDAGFLPLSPSISLSTKT